MFFKFPKVITTLLFIFAFSHMAMGGDIPAPTTPQYDNWSENSPSASPHAPLVSELRLGVFAHNVFGGFIPNSLESKKWNFENWEDVSAEVLFRPLGWFDARYGILRPAIGMTVNLDGKENKLYAALAYKKNLFSSPVFLEGQFGFTVHDGRLDNVASGAELRRLGCRFLFHESASLGYDISPNMSIMATYEHMSNADLCDYNAGLSNMGIRLGYRY